MEPALTVDTPQRRLDSAFTVHFHFIFLHKAMKNTISYISLLIRSLVLTVV